MNASWVAIDLMEFAVRTEDAVQSPEAALEWLRSFRDTLLMEGRNSRPMPWAVELLGMADVKIAKKSIARMQGQIVKIYGADCDVDLECSKKYGEKYEKLKKILADGDIREDSQDIATFGNGSVTESGTSANHYGDAPRREAGEVVNSRESGASEPTTVSRNMRRVPQNEAPAHGFSGGRTAQGTMSRSPEAPAQSGKAYDQEAYQASADGPRQAEDRQSQRAGANAPKGGRTSQSHSATARSSGAMPEDGNPASTAPSNGGSVASLEAQQCLGGGRDPERTFTPSLSPKSSTTDKKAHGEFGNVLLTDDEFAKLQEKTQNAWDLITELDQYIESQGKTKKYKSHYATLLNWSRRKAQEAKPQQRYKNINDINRENCEQIERDLRAMFHPEEVI